MVNHGGILGKEYFIAYLTLIQNSRNCSIQTAKDLTMELFFKKHKGRYEQITYENFLEAYEELKAKEYSDKY